MSHDPCAERAGLLSGSADSLLLVSHTDNAWRRRRTIFAKCALAAGVLALTAAPATAGCNSGNGGTLLSANCQASANGSGAIAIGYGANAPNFVGVAIGDNASAQDYATAIGGVATAPAQGAIAIGAYIGTYGAGLHSTAIGAGAGNPYGAQARGNYSIAIGGGDNVGGNGARADVSAVFGIAIGTGAVAVGIRSASVGAFAGDNAGAGNHRNSAFGTEAGRFVTGAGNTGVGLAAGHTVNGDINSALGNSAGQFVIGHRNTAAGVLAGVTVNGSSNVALGDTAGNNINASHTVAVGTTARATANDAVALGRSARAQKQRSVALGFGSVADAANTVSVGNTNIKRRIVNVAPGTQPNDAVNLAQLQAAVAAVASGTAPAAVAVPTVPEAPAVSVLPVGANHARPANDDTQRRLAQLEELVKHQQERINQLESRVVAAAK